MSSDAATRLVPKKPDTRNVKITVVGCLVLVVGLVAVTSSWKVKGPAPVELYAQNSGVKKSNVTYFAPDGTELTGHLSMPAGTPKASVLVAHAAAGLSWHERERADFFAARGFAALAYDLYGSDATTAEMTRVKEDPFPRVAASARLLEEVNPGGALMAVGYCYGGMVALEIARGILEDFSFVAVSSVHGTLTPAVAPAKEGTMKTHVIIHHGAIDFGVGEISAIETELTKATDGTSTKWQTNVYAGADHVFSNPLDDRYDAYAAIMSHESTALFFDMSLDLVQDPASL